MEQATESLNVMPGQGIDPAKMPGHWLLANLGKRVLRPGGLKLTRRLLNELRISAGDRVVEFAPGMGATARMALRQNPDSYTAVERDQAAAERIRHWLGDHPTRRVITGLAQETGLPAAEATVVYGEAMLTMQTDTRKQAVIREAYRLLQPGGRYGIHELCLVPDDLSDALAQEICRAMTQTIHHHAQPLTIKRWRELFEAEGFKVLHCSTVPMSLLEPVRVFRDEGVCGAMRFLGRLCSQPQARQRVCEMRRVFRQYRRHLAGICIVAHKAVDAPPRS
ncbi:MAG: methyltransferase domain-containing protein [Phycisphaeraceae bacterium]|nr:methyltransferase domain-containing protein [Phycisphaeraceae bacterium]